MAFPLFPPATRLRHQRDDLERALDQTVAAAHQLLASASRQESVPTPVWEALRAFFQAGAEATQGRSPRHWQQFACLAAQAHAAQRRQTSAGST